MGKKLGTLFSDPLGAISWTLDNYQLNINSFFSTLLCLFTAHCWGIKMGRQNRFWGQTHFRRFPRSQIMIGSKCRFRSAFRSNFIGMNRPCGISTHSKEALIRIGDSCGFSATSIGAHQSIVIGNYVFCGANTVITDFDWHVNRKFLQKEAMESAPVTIEDNVWLGMNCVVLKGVHIGANTILGANSVVTHSLPENIIAAGCPARVIKVKVLTKDR